MIHRLGALQKPAMYEAAKTLVAAWTLLCAIGMVAGLIKVLDMASATVVQRAVTEVVTVSYWLTIWTYVTLGLGIIAFVTKPRAAAIKAVN